MNNGRWVSIGEACEIYGVSHNTVRRWCDNGSVESKRTPGNQRVVFVSSKNVFSSTEKAKSNYIYVRVSSAKQKPDMERQLLFLQDKYPDCLVIKDVGSGLNYKRKGLLKLLEKSNKGEVGQVTVFSKDRLCRFGFDLIEWSFAQNGTKIVVHDKIDKSPEEEFSEDILAILQVFACRWNGKRKYKDNKNKEDKIETDQVSKEPLEQME
jgi:predicted site-specific integrase-resolvase